MNSYFVAFEWMVYLLFGLCLGHAWRAGRAAAVWQLIAGVLFGILLEYATIQQLQAYEYGRFLIMLGEVPLPIGVAWGCIVYCARLFSDASPLPGWARPLFDALFALNIDLSMDAIAIRLGFWNWAIDPNSEFFGVPYANFWAWFWVVFSFSAGLRLLSSGRAHLVRTWLAPAGAIVTGVAGVLLTNRLIVQVFRGAPALYLPMILLVLIGALALVAGQWRRRGGRARPDSHLPAVLLTAFHVYFLAAGALAGVFSRLPALLAISLAMALIGAFVHTKTLQKP